LPGNELQLSAEAAPAGTGFVDASMAAAPDGRFVVTYTQVADSTGTAFGVFGRAFNADGTAASPEFGQSGQGTSHSRVAMDAAGDFVLVWEGFRIAGPGGPAASGIYAQLYSATGQPVGNKLVVDENDPAVGVERAPDVAMDAAGDFAVTWDSSDIGAQGSIAARLYAAGGTPVTGPFQVSPDAAQGFSVTPFHARVAMDSVGEFVVVWEQQVVGGGGEHHNVDGQRYDAAAVAQGTPFLINEYISGLEQDPPGVAMDAAGDFVVAWQSWDLSSAPAQANVFAKQFPVGGVVLPAIQINLYSGGEAVRPAVAMDAAGDFAITWASGSAGQNPTGDSAQDTTSEDGSGSGVYARVFDAPGTPLSSIREFAGEFQVNTYTYDQQSTPAVAMDTAGDAIFAWQSHGQISNSFDIIGRRYVQGTVGYRYDPSTGTATITPGSGGSQYLAYSQASLVRSDGIVSTNAIFNLNGVSQTFNLAGLSHVTASADGSGNTAAVATNDTYVANNGFIQETSEVVSLGNGGAAVLKYNTAGQLYTFLTLTGSTNIYASLGSADFGMLQATPGMINVFTARAFFREMIASAGGSYQINGGGTVYGYAADGADEANLYTGDGAATYIASGISYSSMAGTAFGQTFFNEAVGFTMNAGFAENSPVDTAIYYDSIYNDTFVGFSSYSYMQSNAAGGALTELDSAQGFTQTYAYSFVGGTDYSYNYDPQHNHTSGFIVRT
jgi:hypothetical protein